MSFIATLKRDYIDNGLDMALRNPRYLESELLRDTTCSKEQQDYIKRIARMRADHQKKMERQKWWLILAVIINVGVVAALFIYLQAA